MREVPLFVMKRGKMKIIDIIVFTTGIALSVVAGFYSIVGMTAIFSGAFWPIVVLGSVLEIAKLVTVSWLHYNWKIASGYVKSYLISAVIVLMFITSMGIFGFLSKAHIEQQIKIDTGIVTELPSIDFEIKNKEDQLRDYITQIEQIDLAITSIREKGKSSKDAQLSLESAKKEKAKRDELSGKLNVVRTEISTLRTKKIGLESEVKKIEVEVGPIKYVAELIFDSSDTKLLDKTVRIVIIILILVIDPLAIFLLIAFNISVIDKSRDISQMEFVDMPAKYKTKRRGPGRPRKRRPYRRKLIINRIIGGSDPPKANN